MVALHDLLVAENRVVDLRAQADVADRAVPVDRLGDGDALTGLEHPLEHLEVSAADLRRIAARASALAASARSFSADIGLNRGALLAIAASSPLQRRLRPLERGV